MESGERQSVSEAKDREHWGYWKERVWRKELSLKEGVRDKTRDLGAPRKSEEETKRNKSHREEDSQKKRWDVEASERQDVQE